MRKARIILMVLVAVVLAAGTVFERYRGADWVADHFYGSWWFAVLLGLVAVGSLSRVYTLIRSKLIRSHFSSLFIHIAIPVILLGGALTSWTGEHYSITLAPGETKEGITLERFEVLYYPGTHTPMDFVSHVTVADGSAVRKADISMNHILRHDGRRYYQEDYDDEGSTTLSVSHDPWGIPVTYTGYALLLIGLLWLTISKLKPAKLALLLLLLLPAVSQAAPRTLPRETASKMGEMYTLYKGRICPLQTFAKDFTTKLTGKASYQGLTAEQVLAGYLYYFNEWATEPLIKIKGDDARQRLHVTGSRASYNDFLAAGDSFSTKAGMGGMGMPGAGKMDKNIRAASEKRSLIESLLSGKGLKLFPLTDSLGTLGWYAQNDALP